MSDFGGHSLSAAAPEGWKVIPLVDAVEKIIGGGTPARANPSFWKGDIPWLTVKDMRTHRPADSIDHISEDAVENSSTNVIPADTVIIATRIGLGKVIRVPFPAAINQDLKAIILKPEVNKSYFEYWMISIASYLESIGSGTTVKGIRLEQLKSLPFPLAPEDQQQRIVAEIEKQFSRLDEAVASLKRVKANLKRYKAAVLKAAVEGKLTEEWRKRNPDVEPARKLLERILAERRTKWEEIELAKMKSKGKEPKNDRWKEKYKPPPAVSTEELPDLASGWVWANLEQLAEAIPNALKAGPFGSALRKSFYVEKGYKIYGQEQVIRGDAYYGDYYVDRDRYQSLLSCAVKPGDLLISLVGTIGRVLILPDDIAPGIINPRLVKVSLDRRIIEPEFLAAYLGSPFVKAIFSIASHGGTMDVLNLTILKSIPIPLPPVNEQISILFEVDRLDSLALNLEISIADSSKRTTGLRSSILIKAFGGLLTR